MYVIINTFDGIYVRTKVIIILLIIRSLYLIIITFVHTKVYIYNNGSIMVNK